MLESHYMGFAPLIDNNDLKNTTRLAGDVIWQSGIHLRPFLTSSWQPPGRSVHCYLTPRAVLAVEFQRRGLVNDLGYSHFEEFWTRLSTRVKRGYFYT